MFSRLLSSNAEGPKREALYSEAKERPNDEGEAIPPVQAETKSKLEGIPGGVGAAGPKDVDIRREELEIKREELEIKREELKIKREELELQRKEAEVRMRRMEEDQRSRTFDWEMQAFLADRAEFLERKKQWMTATGRKWESDDDAARQMGCRLPMRPKAPFAETSPGCPSQ